MRFQFGSNLCTSWYIFYACHFLIHLTRRIWSNLNDCLERGSRYRSSPTLPWLETITYTCKQSVSLSFKHPCMLLYAHLVFQTWWNYSDMLLGIVLLECFKDTILQSVIIGDQGADIYKRCCLASEGNADKNKLSNRVSYHWRRRWLHQAD